TLAFLQIHNQKIVKTLQTFKGSAETVGFRTSKPEIPGSNPGGPAKFFVFWSVCALTLVPVGLGLSLLF
ncbi:MAG: hypothetical protein QXQ63_04070, partial [Candidatus Bathyarchaeia archaeon]